MSIYWITVLVIVIVGLRCVIFPIVYRNQLRKNTERVRAWSEQDRNNNHLNSDIFRQR